MKNIVLHLCSLLISMVVLAQTPVAYFPFNGNAEDAVGTNHGTVNGATLTKDRFGNANSAYSFDGVNDVIELNHNFGPYTELTVSAWYKVTATSPDLQAILSSDQSGQFLHLQISTAGDADNAVYFNPGPGNLLLTHPMPTLNQWRQVTITAKSGESKIYINGVLIDTKNDAFSSITVAKLLRIGSGYLNGRFFNGAIDDVKIYNTALTGGQVLAEFNTNKPTPNFASQFGNSVLLNGSTDNIDLGNSFTQQVFTIEMWLKPGATQATYADIIDNNHSGSFTNWVCQQDGDNVNKYGFGTMNTGVAFTLTPNVWQHLTLVKSATTIEAYVNGILAQSTPYSGGPINFSGNFLRLGKWGGGGRNWNGSMDEVRFWNTARTPAEIQENMNSELTGSETGLVAYWNMNRKGQGNSLVVENKAVASGPALNGTTVGTATTPVFSAEFAQNAPGSGNAVNFDGANQYITMNTTGYTGIQTYTIECWIKKNAANLESHVWESNGLSAPSLESNGSNELNFWAGNTGKIGTGPLEIGEWYHIACVYDKANTLQSLYVNGILKGSITINVSDAIGSGIAFMRRAFASPPRSFNGSLDEVRIWNTPLTQAQIRDRMCRKITPDDALYGNLVGYYNFDETTGNTAFDGSVNGNNGTLVNDPTRITSGAAIGNISTYNYVITGLPGANLSINAQDNLAVAYTGGTFTGEAGMHIYAVGEAPNTANGINGAGTNNRYFGVFNANISSPTYTATYNYTGNPFVTASTEPFVGLYKRKDNAATTWNIADAAQNMTEKTLTAFGQNTEYMLGSQNSVCGCVGEGGTLTMTAPAGSLFTGIAFASYGLPTGDCGNYAIGSCHAINSQAIVEGFLLNKNTAGIAATNGVFGDPCVGTVKRLCVQAVYGPAAVNSPGTIGADQTICSGSIPALLINISTALGNTANPVVYQWQDSTIGASWQDIASTSIETYQPPALSTNTWYRRKVTIGAYTGFSNEAAITVTAVAGDTAQFPLNTWNVYAFNGADLELGAGVFYRGFYSVNTLNLNSQSDWAATASPSAAAGYQGCSVNTDFFTWVYKRKGFNEGDYIVNSNGVDDMARILVNGTVVYQTTGSGAFGNVSLGHLDANATVEIRCTEATSPAFANFDFMLSSLQPGTVAGNQVICSGSAPANLTNTTAGYGGPSTTLTYQWQDSTLGSTWQNINLATSLSYQPQSLTQTTWYRRNAISGSAMASSNEVTITVLVTGPALIPGITVNNRTLTASAPGAGTIGYQWYKDNLNLDGETNQTFLVPNNDAGQYSVAYTNACGAGLASAPVAIAIAKTDQTISFTPVPAKTFGDAPFEVQASASSTLPITAYSLVSGPATMSGSTITITGAGTITVMATQEGNATFNAAGNTLQIPVAKAVAIIVLGNLTATYDGTGKQATAATNPLGLNNSLTYDGSSTLPVNAGDYTVLATITSPNYQGSATGTLVISKADQTITLTKPGNKSYNDLPFGVTAAATSGLPVGLSIQTIPASGVASIAGNTITLLGLGGSVTITASQAGNSNYNPAGVATAVFEVRPPEAKDMQVTTLLAPTNGCETGVLAPITIRLRNTGTLPASGFPVSYRINSDPVVSETFKGTIAPGANAEFTFATKGIFAQTGVNYQLTLNVNFDGDEIPANNTLLAAVTRFAPAIMSLSADTAICAGGEATLRSFGAGSTLWTGGPNNPIFKVSPASTTTYTANITDDNGCKTETLNVKVTVNANPVLDAGTDQSILRGSSATLSATGANSYLWSNGITTAENTVSPQVTTNYDVTGTSAEGCTATDQVQVSVNFSAITVSPGILQFGGVVVNNMANSVITLSNTGTLPETITAINGLSVPFSAGMVFPVTLPAGTSIQVPVAFNPTATIIYQNKAEIETTAGTFHVTIRGTGVNPAPAWTVTPASFNFGKVAINTTVSQALIIKNTGNVPIRISSISSSSPRFVGSTSGVLDIPVGGSINLTVRFNPTAITAYTGSISIRATLATLGLARAIVAGNGFIPGNPPELNFVNRPPFDGNGGVTPPVGNPGFYTYSVLYRHPQGIAPMAGFPKVGIDKNNDGDFSEDNEGLFTMIKEGAGTNYITGEPFTFTTSLTVSELYGYQFFATDANGNEAVLTEYKKGPIVSREVLDLHIFASDVVFSKQNPAVNENFTVTATIHNNSPYAAAEVPVRFYYKDSLFLFDDIIPFIGGRSKVSITKTLNFSPDGFYPIKIWIDSSQTLGEGNMLNNYASRPVIVGDFSVPGTIDLVSNATPSGCTKGSITFSGRATYRGLNLAGTPPVEGAEVIITIPGYETGRVLKTTTDINGNWYIHDDPCAQDINPEDCSGYQCGITYNYTVEVTDFTLSSPVFASSVTRPCVSCEKTAKLRSGIGVSGCILENAPFTINASLANYEYDFTTNKKICAPTVYHDTVTVYVNGQLANTFTLDSLNTCADAGFSHSAAGLAVGNHQVSMTHVYYFANGERMEESVSGGFNVLPAITDIEIADGISKTGHTSFAFGERNRTCGVPAGPHTVYLYDSLPGYTEKILVDSFKVVSLLPYASAGFSYNNPDWEVGYHYITAYTDVKLEIAELREDNNKMTAIFYVEEPDIYVKEMKISSGSVTAGQLINFSAKIGNSGSPIHQPFKVQFRANGSLLGTPIIIPSLGTNESEIVVSAPFTVPVSLCPVQITAYADVDNEIVEVTKKNNEDTTTFGVNINAGRSCIAETEETVGAGFFDEEDILGTIQCIPYIAPKGVLTFFATTVRNTGSRDATNVRVLFKLNGVELGTDVIPRIKAGEKVESGFYYAFDTLGRFIINAFADYTREICETNEMDNIGNIHVDIKRSISDLEILSQYIAPGNLNPSPGQNITIVSSVVNKGDAPSTPTNMRFWVDDVQLGVDIPIDSLYPGMDTTVMATLTYSNNIVGPKIIKVRADVANTVVERTKRNNEATRAIIVGAAPDFANAISEAITLSPATFNVGDEITIRNYIRNYGGDAGAAWMRFYYRNASGEKILIDSLRFGLERNDSARISMKWTVTESVGQIITEIAGALPPEFNEENNIDSLPFGVALPLNLLSFNGIVRNEEAELSWRTGSEVNVKHFEPERSTDGSRFEPIGFVKPNNTPGQNNYSFTDGGFGKLSVPYVYYRLRMVDLDGSYKYSNIVRLSRNYVVSSLKVYPNPVSYMLQLQVQSAIPGNFSLRVHDASGRLMMNRQYNVTPGVQTLSLPVQHLAKGWYVLSVQHADGSVREVKFIKE